MWGLGAVRFKVLGGGHVKMRVVLESVAGAEALWAGGAGGRRVGRRGVACHDVG